MNAKRLWQIGGVIVVLGILAAGWFLLISPLFDQSGKNDTNAAGVESANATLRTQIGLLQEIDQNALQAEIDAFEVGVPRTPLTPALTRDIKGTVESTGASLTAVTYTEPAVFVPGGTGVDETGAAGGDPAAEGSTASTTVPLPILQSDLDRAKEAGLIDIVVTISLSGDQRQFLAAADALQTNAKRQLLVTGITYSPGGEAGGGTGTINALAWVLPAAPIGAPAP